MTSKAITRTESRLAAWWSAWKYVAILLVLLALSLWGNLHQYGKLKSAGEKCHADIIEAAKRGIEAERERAAKADKQAGDIAHDTKDDTRKGTARAQENTNARQQAIDATRTTGACRMPDGLPRLGPAVAAANAAAGD